MSNWLSRAFARITGKPQPKAAEDMNRAAANTNRPVKVPTVKRRQSSGGPSYGSRASDSGGTYIDYGSYGGYSGDSGGGSDGGGGGGGGGD